MDKWISFLKRTLRRRGGAGATAATGSDSVIVLDVPSRSTSLHYRAYADSIGAASVLEWAIRRLRQATTEATAVYILVDRAEAPRVERAIRPDLGATLWLASGRGELWDLEALARAAKTERLLVVDLAAAVLPAEVFERLLRHHAGSNQHATLLTGVPCPDPPILIEAKLLTTLMRGLPGLPPQLLPQDLRAVLAGLERMMQASGRRGPFRLGYFAPLTTEEQACRGWPYAVRLRGPDDIEILRRAVDGGAPMSDSPPEPLDRWAEAVRELREARVAGLRPHTAVRRNGGAPRRVLYVQSPSAFTGAEQVLVHLAAGIRRDFDPSYEAAALIALPGALTDRLARAGADVHIAQRNFAQNSVEHFLYSRRVLETVRPALVHANSVAGVPFSCAVAEQGIPFVQHVHVADERTLAPLADQIAFASVVIAVSEFVKSRVLRLGVDPGKVHVVHNGIPWPRAQEGPGVTGEAMGEEQDFRRGDWEAIARARGRETCGVPEDAPVVLVVARFAANKRHDVALEAFARLRSRLSGAYLLLAGEALPGDRPVLEAVQRRVEQLRLGDRVRRLGFWPDMPALYAAADVLLLPSEDDPLPLTVLEAMAAGVPVVAARSGGTPEMIEDRASGLLVQPGDVEGFAAALVQVLTEPELRSRLVAGGLARCRTEFSLSRFVHQVGSLYEQLLAGQTRVGAA